MIKNKKTTIFVFGNLLLKKDSLPLTLLPYLKEKFPEINFQIADPNENFPPENEKNLIIIDTVIGIKEPIMINLDDLQKIKTSPLSPHDYDLLFHLLLLKKLKKINTVKIIGIPIKKFKTKKILETVRQLIKKQENNILY